MVQTCPTVEDASVLSATFPFSRVAAGFRDRMWVGSGGGDWSPRHLARGHANNIKQGPNELTPSMAKRDPTYRQCKSFVCKSAKIRLYSAGCSLRCFPEMARSVAQTGGTRNVLPKTSPIGKRTDQVTSRTVSPGQGKCDKLRPVITPAVV